ncbi:haloacid dehalogenase type II [Psychrobacter sp. TAE2020]|uniref:haloacid dehalogenase type II n=1 Tax=Psychrobacter sp. TAE2020 TaxID=2846762 RepID=UPI001C11501A|nr:haloacid dehalogenase type II [Psychrobacter sp. TAE2020]MBU5615804.1 haloacid dehalogenase type II [Psychrobacter sp. TAE2020]
MPQNKPRFIIVFDVNETLLDISSLQPLFERVFGDQTVMREWFAQLVLYSQTLTLSGLYIPFSELALSVLSMLGKIHKITLTDSDLTEFKQCLNNMPAHPDVIPALIRLRDAGFRMVTLTNSVSSTSPTLLDKAGLSQFFEHNFSVETVGKFKPAFETYQLVANELSVETFELCLVACHLWDIIGAQAAGCRGAFVSRSHNAILQAANIPLPDLTAQDMTSLAAQIIREEQA